MCATTGAWAPEEAQSQSRPVAATARTPRINAAAAEDAAASVHDAISEEGQHARGLYLGAAFVRQNGADAVVRLVRSSRMNAIVLDLKDAEGRVHHATAIPELAEMRTGWLGDTAALVRTLHEGNVYAIARIVCFADRRLPEQAPERAIQDVRRNRELWVSWGTGGTWLDPHNTANHQLVVALAREAQALGFDEVQLDYIRFPVDDGVQYATYPAQTEEARTDVMIRLLSAVDEAISIPIGVDVFGLAAYRDGDPSGLGQDLERLARHVEVFTPMLYVNSMQNWRRGEDNRAFRLVYAGIRRLRNRVGPRPVIRPFLQAFRDGADSYGPEFIVDQVRAARRANADGFLFWHPGHTYGVVRQAMQGRGRALVPFPIPEERMRERASGDQTD